MDNAGCVFVLAVLGHCFVFAWGFFVGVLGCCFVLFLLGFFFFFFFFGGGGGFKKKKIGFVVRVSSSNARSNLNIVLHNFVGPTYDCIEKSFPLCDTNI